MTQLLAPAALEVAGPPPAAREPGRRDRTALVVLLAALTVGTLALVAAYRLGFVLQFGDEASHLLAARRVVDSATPGFGQLGQYWLPLYALLELPFVWVDPLYRSGLAGAIPAVLAYAAGTAGAFVLGRELGQARRAGLVAALAYGTTPSLLYLSVRPMMDTTIAACLVWSAALLARHLRTGSLRDLLLASGATAVGCLAHYPLWFVPVLGVGPIVRAALRAEHPWPRIRLTLFLYLLAPTVAVVSWLAWGFYLQHDPFYFLHRAATAAGGPLPPLQTGHRGDLAFVALDVLLAAVTTLGPLLVVVALGVLLAAPLRGRFLHPLVVTAPGWLYLVVTYTVLGGAIGSPLLVRAVGVPGATDTVDNNLRYLLYALPFAVGALAAVVGRSAVRTVLAVLLIVAVLPLQAVVGWGLPTPSDTREFALARATLAKALQERVDLRYGRAAAAPSGAVLLSSSLDGDDVAFRSGLDARTFLTEANGRRYTNGLRDLDRISFVVITAQDALTRRVDWHHLVSLGFAPVPMRPLGGQIWSNGVVDFRHAPADLPYQPWERVPSVTAGLTLVTEDGQGHLVPPAGTAYDMNGYQLWERP
jgi:hypothetical protein